MKQRQLNLFANKKEYRARKEELRLMVENAFPRQLPIFEKPREMRCARP